MKSPQPATWIPLEPLESRTLLANLGPDLTATLYDGVIPASIVPGEGGSVKVNLQNIGDEAAQTPQLTLRLFLSLDATLDGSDIQIGQVSNWLNLAAGKSVQASVPVEVPTSAAPGLYNLILLLDPNVAIVSPEGNGEISVLNNVIPAAQARQVSWRFGTFDARSNVILELPTSTAGKSVFFQMSGAGYGLVTGNAADGYEVVIRNSTATSAATVTTQAGVSLAGVDVQGGSLKAFAAKGVGLTGDFNVDGSLGTLTLGDVGVAGAGDIALNIGNPAVGKPTLSATLGRVANVQLNSDIPIKTLTLIDWTDDADSPDTVTAPSIATLSVTGRGGVTGDMDADLTLTGAATAANLGKARITGDLTGCNWTIAGGLKSLTVLGSVTNSTIRTTASMDSLVLGASIDSNFLAGIAPAVTQHAEAADDFINTAATIKSFRITGWSIPANDTTRFFDNSNLSAAKMGAVSLLNMELSNGASGFGLYLKSVVGLGEVKSVACNDTYTGWSWIWKPKNENPFALQDFAVTIL